MKKDFNIETKDMGEMNVIYAHKMIDTKILSHSYKSNP